MSLGGPVLRQHVVEFIDGTGVKTDGVVNTSDTATPFSWTVPVGVTKLFVTGCGGGAGGTGGINNATQASGGGGGGAGMCVMNMPVDVVPGSSLTIAIGSAGSGGTVGNGNSAGGNTTVSPVVVTVGNVNDTTLKLLGGKSLTLVGTSGRAGSLGGYMEGTNGTGAVVAASPIAGNTGNSFALYAPAFFYVRGGAGGGAYSSTSASTPGSDGGGVGSNTIANWMDQGGVTAATGGAGGQNGTRSTGGGGAGAPSLFGNGGNGGGNAASSSQNGTNATGYGAGGGAGGGGGDGGSGTKGYLRFVYWSAD